MHPYTEDQSQPSNSGLLRFRSAPSSVLSSFKGHDFIQSAAVDSSSQNQFPPPYSNPALVVERNPIRVNSTTMDQSTQGKVRVDRSNLTRQSCSPAGFFSNLNTQDGYGMVGGGIESFRFSTCTSSANANANALFITHHPHQTRVLSHHLSLPKTSAAVEKLLNSEDAVPSL